MVGIPKCENGKEDTRGEEKSQVVDIYLVSSTGVRQDFTVSGNIEGNTTVRLGFMVPGKVNYIASDEGESIRAGQVLASVDPESYQIAKVMSDAEVDQTQDDYDRLRELYNRNSLAESDMVKITMSLRAAKAQQRLRAKNLRDTKLRSPIDGILIKKGVEVGEIIEQGLPVFAVADINTVKVVASVPQMELRYIEMGNKAEVYVASVDSTFIGSVVEIGTLADSQTRTFPVKIELENPKQLLRPGMTAEVNMETGLSTIHIAVPANCILRDLDNSSYVFVADTVKMKAFKCLVSIGQVIDNRIEVTSGLSPGDMVIVTGLSKLNNGSSISFK